MTQPTLSEILLQQHLQTALPQARESMRNAIVDIFIHQLTWRQASIRRDVTESGILKAIQRGKVRDFVANYCKSN